MAFKNKMISEAVELWSKYSTYTDRKNRMAMAREKKRLEKFKKEHPNSMSLYVPGRPEEKTLVGFMEYLKDKYE
jgi:hypothetical protein